MKSQGDFHCLRERNIDGKIFFKLDKIKTFFGDYIQSLTS